MFLLYLTSVNLAEAGCVLIDKVTGKEFKIFNALLYDDLLELNRYCIEDINVMYAWNFIPRRYKNGDMEFPLKKHVDKAIKKIRSKKQVTVIDLEHWPLKNSTDEVINLSVSNYYNVMSDLKDALPDIVIGYYGVIPIKDFSRAKMSEKNHRYQEWVKESSRLKDVGYIVDAAFPSLYTIDNNRNSWKTRGISQIKEARKIIKDKPVYPFIWPNYHEQGGRYPTGTEVEPDYWKLQLNILRTHADGMVLWGGNRQKFNQDMKWWKITVDFIEQNFIIKSN